jgi:hypothetical protein
VLHDPRLWLGIALHSLLEKARNGVVGTDLGDAWQTEVRHFMQEAELHQFDRRFSNLVRWPNYYLMEERALSAAAELVAAQNNTAGSGRARTQGQRLPHSGTERRLVARSGRLVGRPDRFDRNSITDYKSNLPDTSTALGVQIFRQDRRQIQIYAAIIAESFGFWPTTGIIAGASGETAEFPLAPAECDAEADAAVADLAAWNRALSSASRPSDIASQVPLSACLPGFLDVARAAQPERHAFQSASGGCRRPEIDPAGERRRSADNFSGRSGLDPAWDDRDKLGDAALDPRAFAAERYRIRMQDRRRGDAPRRSLDGRLADGRGAGGSNSSDQSWSACGIYLWVKLEFRLCDGQTSQAPSPAQAGASKPRRSDVPDPFIRDGARTRGQANSVPVWHQIPDECARSSGKAGLRQQDPEVRDLCSRMLLALA